jgi:hypothetical protein
MSREPQDASPVLHASSSGGAGATIALWMARVRAIPRGKLTAILILLLAGIVAVYLVEPRIETSVGTPPDSQRPILTPFVISNGGFFSFRDVHAQCIARAVEFEQAAAASKPQINNDVLHVTNVATPSLRAGQKIAVTCAKGLENQPGALQHADVDVNVCLKPYPLIDYISLVHFRYVGEREASGQVRWSAQQPRRSSVAWLVIQGESDKPECKWAE